MTHSVYIAVSLDGFIATPDGGIDWLNEIPNPEKSDYGFAKFIETIDAIVMGRFTYEKALTFDPWPYTKPVFVLSRTLTAPPARLTGRVEFIHGAVKTLVEELHARGYQNLYIDGGKTIQAFLAEDLIDELILTRIPILLGQGIPLFGNLPQCLKFSHQKTDVYGQLVMSFYNRIHN